MRILHVCQFLGIGGLEKVLLDLCKEQIKCGHQVSLIVYDNDQRWNNRFREIGVKLNNDYLKSDGFDLELINRLQQVVFKHDIVHTHDLNPAIYLGTLSLINLVKYGKRVQFVHTTHGMEHIKARPITKLYELLVGLTASKIISVSEAFKLYYEKQPLTKLSKLHVVKNGVELPDQSTNCPRSTLCEEFNLDHSRPIGVYVARITPLKDQLRLIESYRDSNHQLVLVGPPSDHTYFTRCRERITPNIVLTGARDDIMELLRMADYYISTSKHEGLPISVLEAGVIELPCLLSRIPGHLLFNQHKECVSILGHTDHPLNAIEDFLKNAHRLTRNFKEEIIDRYSAHTMYKEYLSIYQEVLES